MKFLLSVILAVLAASPSLAQYYVSKANSDGSGAWSYTLPPTTISGLAGTATALATPRTINGVSFNGSANVIVTAAGSTLSDPVTFANGANSGSASTSATTGAITVNMTNSVVTCTPTGAMTYNGSGGVIGQILSFVITTSGTSSFVLTFGTNIKSTGTLATGTTTAKMFVVTFRCYATGLWAEMGRTVAM